MLKFVNFQFFKIYNILILNIWTKLHIVLPSFGRYIVYAYFYVVICRTVAVVSKHWAVSSMLPMLSELCSCWPVGSGH